MSESSVPPQPPLDPYIKEIWDYLMEVLGDYETFLKNIGDLGFSAPQLLYYRDEVQECLDELAGRPDVNVTGAWRKTTELDTILRARAQTLVDEIGHKNFTQYQIQNDPPRSHWWWWLNRVTVAPPPQPKIWEFWKFQAQSSPQPSEPPPPPPQPTEPALDARVAKAFQDFTMEDVRQERKRPQVERPAAPPDGTAPQTPS